MAYTNAPRDRAGWRRLGLFWLIVIALLGSGTGVLTWLGPPDAASPSTASPGTASAAPGAIGRDVPPIAAPPEPRVPSPSRHADAISPVGPPMAPTVRQTPVVPRLAGRDTPGPVADPDPALSEPMGKDTEQMLPRISPDGRTSMRVYASGYDFSSRRPRVGLLLAGIGPNESESVAAIRALPGGVSLAISPYAGNLARLLATARATGHEYLIELPLEPSGFPLNDPGPETLLTSLTPAENLRHLHWALSRIDGYVGATGLVGGMRGERLAEMTDQMDALLSELGDRGLLYVDPREGGGKVARTWGRRADLVVDDPLDLGVADRAMIDAKLSALEQIARDTGSALGVVTRPTPVAVARIAAWSLGIADRGLALAPVSALVVAPADAAVKLTQLEP